MSATGLRPDELAAAKAIRVPKRRLAEFDQLMAEGGIQAVVAALIKDAVPESE